ncbi:MAG: hypothetical protein K5641_02565 [Lachnospiraceae bacterium]|nr:hypothetical protein [Lachnospiraceae bacterium]
MKNKLTNNLGLKLLSILFSIVIWFIVVNINDPVDKTVFRNIPVEILHANSILDQGKVYEILDGTDMIDVTVWAKRSVLNTLGRENIIATADMEEINFMDTMVRIKLSTNKYNDKLESITASSENLSISIEDLKKKQFVIEAGTVGEPADGFVLGNMVSDKNLLVVSGPASLVDRVAKAAVSVDVTGLSQDIHTDATILLYDEKLNIVDDVNIKKSIGQVRMNIEILQTKRVPINFDVMGVPASGYAVTGKIDASPSTLLVSGKNSVIKNLNSIDVPDTALNVTGQIKNMTTVVELKRYLPDGVNIAEAKFNGKATVTVYIEKQQSATVVLPGNRITAINVPSGYHATPLVDDDDEMKIRVTGLAKNVSDVESSKISASVDVGAYMSDNSLSELKEGTYSIKAALHLPEGVAAEESVTIRINIQKEEENSNG